ncbi:MAG: cytochrome c biogenesis protein ResB [Jiangellaceae bacterium]
MTVREASTTAAPEPPARPQALTPRESAAWAWRQLTSMRVALILLFLLAVAAIPGSVVPQRDVNPLAVSDFRTRNPGLAEWYDRLGLFDVFSAPWFAAIYIALVVSLVGCILPRSLRHWRAIRAQPPPAPRLLSRMPAHRQFDVVAPPPEVLDAAVAELRARRFRLAHDGPGPRAVAAEAGHLRETGNLLFHLAVVVVLLAVAAGSLFGYRATVIVAAGSGFANTVIQYDEFDSGALFDPKDLPPFSLELDEFRMEFVDAGPQLGMADDFQATVRVTPEPGAATEEHTIRVNEPLGIDGTLVHILNPGYAPMITVRDADGTVLAEGPVPFLPEDEAYRGVRKVPVAPDVATGEDLGVEAVFLPTAVVDDGRPRSVFPGAENPALYLTAFHGDLGLDDGEPQSVYRLDLSELEQFRMPDGSPLQALLTEGETVALPDGYGSVTFDGYVTWVQFQIGRNAGKEFVLLGALTAVAGLLASLYVRRRRLWVRVADGPGGGTVVEVAALQRSEGGDLDSEVDEIADGVRRRLRPANVEG